MKNLYVITLKRNYCDAEVFNVAAKDGAAAIERARIQAWKSRKFYKKSDWDIIGLMKSETQITV